MSINWVACGTWYTKTEGTELGGLKCSISVNFFQVGGHIDHLRGHHDVVLAVALWLTCSHVKLFCNVLSRLTSFTFLSFGSKFSSKITKLACKQAFLLKMGRCLNIGASSLVLKASPYISTVCHFCGRACLQAVTKHALE